MRFYTKTLILSVCFAVITFAAVQAQPSDTPPGPGTVTVYSESGENFTLFINGDRKNGAPSSRVVTNVSEVPVAFRITFADGTPELTKKGMRQGTNCLYAVEKNKKGVHVLKVKGCNDDAVVSTEPVAPSQPAAPSAPVGGEQPAKLSAAYANGVITLNDGRTFAVKKVKAHGMTFPRVIVTALTGSQISLAYDNGNEKYSAEAPMQYEVKDFTNNNAYFTLTVDEGGPDKTWHVKLQNSNGYDLKIE